MLSTPVGAPPTLMVPPRLADLGRVGWTLARAFAPRRHVVLAALTWPAVVLLMAAVPGTVHDGGDVVVRMDRRGTPPSARDVGHLLLLSVVAGVGTATVATAVGLLTGSAAAGWVVAAGWPVSGLVVLLTGWAVVSTRIAGVHRAALRSAGAQQRRADRRVFRDAEWLVGGFAARPGTSGLTVVADHVRATAGPGETVVVVAASARHALVYSRFGLRPLPSLPLVLVGTIPTAG
jgi:hypothetical protein